MPEGSLLNLEPQPALAASTRASLGFYLASFGDPQLQVYGTPPSNVFVFGGQTPNRDPIGALETFRAGYNAIADTPLGEGDAVNAGALGGAGRCWLTESDGAPLGLCAFADGQTTFALLDGVVSDDLEALAERGRVAREASVAVQ